MRLRTGLLAVATMACSVTLAAAQTVSARSAADSALDAQTTAVAAQLRCPVCQGLSIQDSPSELSQQMRNLVKEQLAAGKSPEEVMAYFVSKYGEWILLAPRARGFNLVAYGLPAVLFLSGLGFIAWIVRRWTAAGAMDSASNPLATTDPTSDATSDTA